MIFTDKQQYALSFQTDIRLELNKIKELLSLLGNPQENMEFIHVAGTNGKGSVCAFLESMLCFQGVKVGRFSSPELIKKNETIRINGNDISDSDLFSLIFRVSEKGELMKEYPSPFEIICAAALLYFKEQSCDIVILEAGMGGEGDATNVIENTKICVLCQIALDHMQYLGSTVEEITRVKCGIIKSGSMVVTTGNNGDYNFITEKCKAVGARLCPCTEFVSSSFEGCSEIIEYNNTAVKLSLKGITQLQNSALAVKAAQLLKISDENIIKGLENACNKGRFEELGEGVYFDGAHNPNGAAALKKSLDRYMPGEEKVYIMGVMKDKSFGEMAAILKDEYSSFVFVNVKGNSRAMKCEEMQRIAEDFGVSSVIFSDVNTAIENVRGKNIIICGSLYMYKDIDFEKLSMLRGKSNEL